MSSCRLHDLRQFVGGIRCLFASEHKAVRSSRLVFSMKTEHAPLNSSSGLRFTDFCRCVPILGVVPVKAWNVRGHDALSLSLPVRWSMWTTMETNWAREWWSWPTPSSSSIPIAAMTSGGLICACAAMATTLTCSRSRAAAAARRAKVRIRVCQQEMRSPQDRVCVCWLKVFLVSGLCLAMIRCQEGGVGGAVRSGGLVSLSRMSFVLPRPRSVLISCRWKSVWVKTCLQCLWCVIHLALVPVRSQQNHQNDPDQ